MLCSLQSIMRIAGQMMLDAQNAAIHQKEGHFNFVTDTDVAVQEFLKKELSRLAPDAFFFSEEQENAALTASPTFVIDPIDGTINFMRNRRQSAISIAYLVDKQPVLAAVYNPYANEMFTAEKDKGAFLNGKPIHVSDTSFEKCVTAFGTSPYDAELAKQTMTCALDFLLHGGDLRRTGSACVDLCDVACGRADLFFELRLRPWDVAAGSLIVQEAGGFYQSIGHPVPFYDDACGMICGNQKCKDDALRILKGRNIL